MKRYAVLDQNGVVVNIIVATTAAIAEQTTGSDCIHITPGTTVDIGYSYSDSTFSAPTPPAE